MINNLHRASCSILNNYLNYLEILKIKIRKKTMGVAMPDKPSCITGLNKMLNYITNIKIAFNTIR